jgi:uncharacterized protein (TIGR02391 family)
VPNFWTNYFHAVFEATKGVAERIRQLSGLSGDGADLVNKAFTGQQPVLLWIALYRLRKSEQKGFANLLIGLFGAVRNPLAHSPKKNWPMSELDALDILTLVSLIHRKLDGTEKIAADPSGVAQLQVLILLYHHYKKLRND